MLKIFQNLNGRVCRVKLSVLRQKFSKADYLALKDEEIPLVEM